MITDKPPRRGPRKDEYERSDAMRTLDLPPVEPLRLLAARLEKALSSEDRKLIEVECNAIAANVARSLKAKAPPVKVLGVRPLEVNEDFVDETFGDYDPNTARIRLWMRTAIQQKPTAFGTLLSTLCHEICHHLDVVTWGFPNTFHTRGFYERSGLLYHHVRGTPLRKLVWTEQSDGTYRINWPATMGHARAQR